MMKPYTYEDVTVAHQILEYHFSEVPSGREYGARLYFLTHNESLKAQCRLDPYLKSDVLYMLNELHETSSLVGHICKKVIQNIDEYMELPEYKDTIEPMYYRG